MSERKNRETNRLAAPRRSRTHVASVCRCRIGRIESSSKHRASTNQELASGRVALAVARQGSHRPKMLSGMLLWPIRQPASATSTEVPYAGGTASRPHLLEWHRLPQLFHSEVTRRHRGRKVQSRLLRWHQHVNTCYSRTGGENGEQHGRGFVEPGGVGNAAENLTVRSGRGFAKPRFRPSNKKSVRFSTKVSRR